MAPCCVPEASLGGVAAALEVQLIRNRSWIAKRYLATAGYRGRRMAVRTGPMEFWPPLIGKMARLPAPVRKPAAPRGPGRAPSPINRKRRNAIRTLAAAGTVVANRAAWTATRR